jgi:hypothetical protein
MIEEVGLLYDDAVVEQVDIRYEVYIDFSERRY